MQEDTADLTGFTLADSTRPVWIAETQDTATPELNGSMDEIRITKGTALWISDFEVPNYADAMNSVETSVAGQTALAQVRGSDVSAIIDKSMANGGSAQFIIDEGTADERIVTVDSSADSGQARKIRTLATSLSDDLHTIRLVNLENKTIALDAMQSNGHAPILKKAASSEISYEEAAADLNPETSEEGKTNDVFYWDTANDSDERGDLLLKGALASDGTLLTVDSGTGSDLDYLSRPSGVIQIGTEKIKYGNFVQSASEATLLNITRGHNGTSAAAHSDDAEVTPNGGWRSNATTRNSSWYGEADMMPEELKLIAMDTGLSLLDSSDNSLWMHFAKDTGNAISTSVQAVTAVDGAIYAGTENGVIKIDFANDEIVKIVGQNIYSSIDTSDVFVNRNSGEFYYSDQTALHQGNLAASWSMDEVENGKVYDASGSGHTATVVGDTTFTTDGPSGKAASFDGDGDYLSVPDSDDFDFGSGDFSVDFWVKHTDHSGFEHYITHFEDASNKWYFRRDDTNGLLFYSEGTATIEVSGADITDTNWHHLALVKSGSLFTIYKD